MENLKFEWKEDTKPYSNGYVLYIKKFCLGGVCYNASRTKSSTIGSYKIYNSIGLKIRVTNFNTVEEGKASLEKFITSFVNYLIS